MLASGVVATMVAVLTWAFIEAFGRYYPARPAWFRMRRARGRLAVRRMRERFEQAVERTNVRRLALVLLLLMLGWIGAAGLLNKRWYEVVTDVAPTVIVLGAALRIPAALRAVAERMREYERSVGEDPDLPLQEEWEGGDGGPTTMAL